MLEKHIPPFTKFFLMGWGSIKKILTPFPHQIIFWIKGWGSLKNISILPLKKNYNVFIIDKVSKKTFQLHSLN